MTGAFRPLGDAAPQDGDKPTSRASRSRAKARVCGYSSQTEPKAVAPRGSG